MTDDLSIQAQQPQRGSYALPAAIGGAGLGAVGGYYTPMLSKSYKSYEDLIAESEDTFKSQIEKGGENKSYWEKAKEHADKVRNAETEFDKKVEEIKKNHASIASGLPEDNQIAKDLKTAQEKYDAELKNLIDNEKSKLGTTGAAEIHAKDIKAFDKVNTQQLPTEYAFGKQKGKKIPANQVESLYNSLTGDLRTAETNLETTLNSGLRAQKTARFNSIQNTFGQAFGDVAALSDDKVAEYFNNKTTWSIFGGTKATPQYQRVLNVVNAYYPDVTKLTDEQIMSIGTELKAGEKVPSGMATKAVTITDPVTKRPVVKTVYFDSNAYDNLLKAEKDRIASLRTTAADQIFTETQKAVSIKREMTAFPVNFEQNVAKDLATNTGLYDTATNKLDLAKILNEGKGTATHGTGTSAITGYAADIKKLVEAKKAGTTVIPAGLNGSYTGNIEQALKQAQARQNVFKKYTKQLTTLEKQFNECVGNNPIIQEFDTKIANAISQDKAVIKARQRLSQQFPGLFPAKEALSADEIAKKAEEAAKKAIEGKEVNTTLQSLKEKAVKEAERLGVKGEGLTAEGEKLLKDLGSKEEYTKKLKDAAKEALEKDLGKFKTSNKWANAAIGAAVLAAAGLGIGAMMKKDA